jgi:heptosyltransferase II
VTTLGFNSLLRRDEIIVRRESFVDPAGVASTFGQSKPTHHSAKKIASPRRIVVKEVNWLGDLVMSLPALRGIRRNYPDAYLAVLIRRELASFFDGADWIDEVIPYTVRRGVGGVLDRARIINEIRARRFDLAVLFPRSFEAAFWMTMARVRERAGFIADARGPLLTIGANVPSDATRDHQSKYWLAMIRETLGIGDSATDFAIAPHAPNLARMRTWLAAHRRRPAARLVAIAPAAAYGPAKEWPAENFAALVDSIAERWTAECVLVGAPAERAKCEEVARAAATGAIIAAGETNIGELIALLSLSDAFIGNDSGAMHIAGALGIKTVALFGSTNPFRTGPLGTKTWVVYHRLECSPCLARTCRFGHYNCLKQIVPSEPVDALLALDARAG